MKVILQPFKSDISEETLSSAIRNSESLEFNKIIKRIFCSFFIISSLSCYHPIDLEIAPSGWISFENKPENFLTLLPVFDELKNRSVQDPQLQQEIHEFSDALFCLCLGDKREAIDRIRRFYEKSENAVFKNQVFLLLMQFYYHHGDWKEMEGLTEKQGERIKNIYKDHIIQLSELPLENITFHQKKTILPLIIKNGLMLINVSINGKQAVMLIDTGASKSMIYSSFAEKYGITPRFFREVKTPVFINQHQESRIGVINEMKIGEISIAQHQTLVMPSLLFNFLVPKIDGVLGWNALRHFRIKIDIQKKTISFSQSTKKNDNNRNFFWLVYPIVHLHTISGDNVFMKLDTGSKNSLFNDNLIKKNLIRIGTHKKRESWGLNKYLWIGTPLDLVLDQNIIKFKTTQINKQMKLSDLISVDGLLGCDLLDLGTFVIDYQNGIFRLVSKTTS